MSRKNKPIIPVRKLFLLPAEKVLNLKTNLNLQFEDDVVIENAYYKDVILFRYFLDFLNRFQVTITSDLWITNYYVEGYFASSTYLNLYTKIYKKFFKENLDPTKDNSETLRALFKAMYDTVYKVNKYLVRDIIEYAIDVEIQDILEIQFDQELLEAIAKASVEKSQDAIEHTYKTLDNIFHTRKYKDNLMTMLYLSGAVSKDQIKQLLGSRGYLTELDSKLFKEPMTNSFALGFKNMYDAAIESRAGAKAQYLSSKAIQDSEYANREVQLFTMVVERIQREPCKHPTYVEFLVRPPEYNDNGKLIHGGDLKNLIGKYYLDPETGEEKVITGNEKHLIGKTIEIRSGVYCSCSDKKAICSKCLGEISHSILNRENLGNIVSAFVNAKKSQSLLSAKHLLKSATTTPLELDSTVTDFFILKKEKLYPRANTVNKRNVRVYLRINQNEAWGLKSAIQMKNIRNITINKISRLESVDLVFVDEKTGDVKEEVTIPLKSKNRYAYLTIPFIGYVMEKGYTTPDEKTYLIDITNYPNKQSIFMYEEKEFDFSALNSEFKKLIKSRKFIKVDGVYRSEYAPHVLVEKLFRLINTKLNINLALIEVIVYALTIQDPNELDYDLGRNSSIKNVGGFKEVIDGRSLGASYDWDDLQNKILHPLLYKKEHKPSTPMDTFLKPNEVIMYEGEQ